MLEKLLLFSSLILINSLAFPQNNYSPSYWELIDEYEILANDNPDLCQLDSFGLTDRGVPLHCLIINSKGKFHRNEIQDQAVILIMNGIHPGEPCGVNASLQLAKEKIKNPDNFVTYCIIPVYNTGGMMNRGSFSRANQNGPEEYGFRGNTKNLDLNRDFIKADSKNAQSFYQLFQEWQPHIFIDTHTSNGADYQPTLTLLSTFPENLEEPQAKYLETILEPELYRSMEAQNQEMVPYVNVFRTVPDSGYKAFTDYPRYSTGYTSLFNVIGFTTEAHMLKPFDDRVKATLLFLNLVSDHAEKNYQKLIEIKAQADEVTANRTSIPYNWQVTDEVEWLEFPGFEASTDSISAVTGMPTLRYNRNRPYRKNIPYYAHHEAIDTYDLPEFYVLSGGWSEVIHLLDLNQVQYERIERDTLIDVMSTYISEFETFDNPYEGHYKHYNIQTEIKSQRIHFFPGDLIIPTNQAAKKYLASVFNPKAADSFFSWNFFDSCLMQKEYFSTYVFDQTATQLLKSNEKLKREFDQLKEADPAFAKSTRLQLEFIYEHSPYYETSHRRLPVYQLH